MSVRRRDHIYGASPVLIREVQRVRSGLPRDPNERVSYRELGKEALMLLACWNVGLHNHLPPDATYNPPPPGFPLPQYERCEACNADKALELKQIGDATHPGVLKGLVY